MNITFLQNIFIIFLSSFLFVGCDYTSIEDNINNSVNNKYIQNYEGLTLYSKNMNMNSYRLDRLSNEEFNALSEPNKLIVANKLLATMYFGFTKDQLTTYIDSGIFISTIKVMISKTRNDLAQVEARLNNNGDEEEEFYFATWPKGTKEVSRILARFYAFEHLDKHYVDYWSAYILTQNIMFSPAYELASSHVPNIERVYSSLVKNNQDETTAAYASWLYMTSDDNWRRFRSPEDNGREMMEIFLNNFDDTLVPLAGQALKNWRLDRDNDTLVVGLDSNMIPINIFDTTVIDGFDFYRELVKSDDFNKGITNRLVEIYFPTFSYEEKESITNDIVLSNPKTWQDILLQIVFSKKYLLESDKPKSAEELLFSLQKRINFEHKRGFFSTFVRSLQDMNQASMKYKLGKYTSVPLDTQSFISYHKFIREQVLIRNRNDWRSGWLEDEFIPDILFEGISAYETQAMLDTLIDHVFISTISRVADEDEKLLFRNHMLDSEGQYHNNFKLFMTSDNPLDGRVRASVIIMDYISRLSQTYEFQKVK